jgi:hypothetical protein
MAGPPFPIPNLQAPSGVVGLDNVTGANGASNIASYTLSTGAGTNTITTGRSTPGGVFLGAQPLTGTPTYQAFDVIVSGTTTTTNALTALTTSALGTPISPGPAGVGVRFLGNLVIVTGTGTINTLWD